MNALQQLINALLLLLLLFHQKFSQAHLSFVYELDIANYLTYGLNNM